MTVSRTNRFGLTQSSDDLDPPVNRTQLNGDYSSIESLAAIGSNGALTARPPAGIRDRLYLVSSGDQAGTLWWDTGTAWVQVVNRRTWWESRTFSVPGEVLIHTAADQIPGFSEPVRSTQQTWLYGVMASLSEGAATIELRAAGTPVGGLTMAVTTVPTVFRATAPVRLSDLDYVQALVTARPGATPRNLSLSVLLEMTA